LVASLRGRPALLPVLDSGDQQLGAFGEQVVLGAVAGVRQQHADLGGDSGVDQVLLGLGEHGLQLAHVVGVLGDVGGEDDLLLGHDRLGVVALDEALGELHEPGVGSVTFAAWDGWQAWS
jgi:hypothetical protein